MTMTLVMTAAICLLAGFAAGFFGLEKWADFRLAKMRAAKNDVEAARGGVSDADLDPETRRIKEDMMEKVDALEGSEVPPNARLAHVASHALIATALARNCDGIHMEIRACKGPNEEPFGDWMVHVERMNHDEDDGESRSLH